MLNNSDLYNSEWLALVFKNRNQNYGAFVLRSQSATILLKSLLIVSPFFIMLFVGPLIYGQLHRVEPETTRTTVVTIADPIFDMPKKEEKKEEVKKQDPVKSLPPAKQQVVKSTQFTDHIKVVENTTVEPPTTEQISTTAISTVTQDGLSGSNAMPASPKTGEGTGSNTDGTGTNEVKSIGEVDQYPEFPGGMEAWSKFIQKNLRYPYPAQEQNIQGKVFLSFVVEVDGSITDVKVVKGIGYGCDDEAVRVIKKSPKWKAGRQNQQFVRVRYNMPINYMLNL